MRVSHNVPFSELTTLRLGGPAATVIEAESTEEVRDVLRETEGELLVLGGGSNLVVGDEGFDGTVLRQVNTVFGFAHDSHTVQFTAPAGRSWDDLVRMCVEQGWAGLESLAGIPGLVGAAPVQNIGAYGHELAETVQYVEAVEVTTGDVVELDAKLCGFGYRTSLFKQRPGEYVITGVRLHLRVGGESLPVTYAELANRLGVELGATAPVAEVREAVLDLRRGKGMVLDADDHDTWSAGSFFTNPIVEPGRIPDDAPRWPVEGTTELLKTSAAWLIAHAGIEKGLTVGGAAVSSKHTLALTNRGGATTADLLELARIVIAAVEDRYGIRLVNEPVLVNCSL